MVKNKLTYFHVRKICPNWTCSVKRPDEIAPKLWASVMVNERMAKTNARGHWPLQSFNISWAKKMGCLSLAYFHVY